MSKTNISQRPHHDAVMVSEVLKYLSPARGLSYLDLTAGYGGHTKAIAEATGEFDRLTLVDRDDNAVTVLKNSFPGAEILHQDFASASADLVKASRQYDMILADLGASSPHFDSAIRGFSFSNEGPLDMRMDRRQKLTAEQLINESAESELAQTFARYGEESQAKRIAANIVANRPINSTTELAKVVEASVGRRFGRHRIHPATKVFQALRIAVNDELGQLESSLPLWVDLLKPGGRLVIISFHSLEDRIVKRYFSEHAGPNYDAELSLLTKKPVQPSSIEIASNPRARSAKLRAGRKK
jgi:16S rRNA (cytosine1402-N4)-methyltransferase